MHIGTITHWNAEKGYGFIRQQQGGEDVFFHISTWSASHAPREGLQVYYQMQTNPDGRLAATAVALEAHSANQAPTKLSPVAKWFNTALIAILLLLGAIFGIDFFTLNGDNATTQNSQQTQQAAAFAHIQDPALSRTLQLIAQGGPFPYPEHDGKTFYNREGLLPQKAVGYYREYTVPTSGANNRGKKRVVTGGNPPEVYYYTDDHYESFRLLEKSP